ncbi:hypothetical protein FACS18949_05150 [Clostridia bacterium]|nr:hypothetical protein FACS18949_05150 [Clostridia bacterium]
MSNRVIADITDFIFLADEPRKANAIFIPGGSDPAPSELAAKLYANGFAPLLIPSGGVSVKTGKFNGVQRNAERYDGGYKTDCEFMTDVLMKNGVPAHAIIGEDKSGYTKENATLSRKVADGKGLTIKTAIVCCKSFHARRCLMCYQFAFPKTEILIAPAEVFGINRDNWYTFDYGIERVMGELARCGNQFVDEVLALSIKSKPR